MARHNQERLWWRGGTAYFRVKVPADLVESYRVRPDCIIGVRATVVGKPIGAMSAVIAKSLRTTDANEARRRFSLVNGQVEQEFANRRAAIANTASIVTDAPIHYHSPGALIAACVANMEVEELETRRQLFAASIANPDAFWKGEVTPLPDTPYFEHLANDLDLESFLVALNHYRTRARIKALRVALSVGKLDAFAKVAEGHFELDGRTQTKFARALAMAQIEVLEKIVAGEGDLAKTFDSLNQADTLAVKKIGLVPLFDKWVDERKPSASTVSTWRGNVKKLAKFRPTKASNVALFNKDDLIAFKDHLVDNGLARKSINTSYLASLNRLFEFAITNGYAPLNPVEDVKAEGRQAPGEEMQGYSTADVHKMLLMARAETVPFKRWLPWLLAATGARVGELTQLSGKSFKRLNDDLIVVEIQPAEDAGSIKTAGSIRTVPLHVEVVLEGFMEFVRSKGSGPLFYGKSSGDSRKKHASKGVNNRFAEWVRERGFKNPKVAPAHGFRHWFKSEASRIGIPDSIADMIQGHKDKTAAGGYRHADIDRMALELRKIELLPKEQAKE